MLNYIKILCTTAVIGALVGNDVYGRVFTDIKGRKIEAEIVSLDGGRVMIKLQQTGKTAEVKIEVLSKADRDYAMQWMKDKNALAAQQRAHSHEHSQTGINSHTSSLMTQYDLKENYDAKWPRLVSTDIGIDISVMSEDENKREFVYHSPNYEFVCDVKLTKNVVKKFAVMFEATREYCRLLPISTMKAHVPGGEFRHKILLFENEETYLQNGGMPGSAGVFVSRGGNGVVMVPLTSLGVIKGKAGYRYDYDKSNKTLTHEIAHQLTDIEYLSSPGSRGVVFRRLG